MAGKGIRCRCVVHGRVHVYGVAARWVGRVYIVPAQCLGKAKTVLLNSGCICVLLTVGTAFESLTDKLVYNWYLSVDNI